jgi:hypothetical protein
MGCVGSLGSRFCFCCNEVIQVGIRTFTSALIISGLLVSGCSGSTTQPKDGLSAETASFDLVAGKNSRLMVGVSDIEGNVLTGGTVQFRIRPAGSDNWSTSVPATYLSVPGRPASTADKPSLTSPSEAVGVYGTGPITIPTDGFWEVEINAGKLGMAMTAFQALPQPNVVAVGTGAPASENPTVSTSGITASQLDSAAVDAKDLNTLADTNLHTVQIAKSLADHRPLLVVVATPGFCTSKFCGPLVDELSTLQPRYLNVDFVHLEVYPEGYDKPVSPLANQWIKAGSSKTEEGNEPWVFVIDGSGTITQRWDNVVDMTALKQELSRLN